MPEVIKGGDAEIGSPNWLKFLEQPKNKSFRYEGINGNFTARKRNNNAWYAYRKFGKLRQEYLGLSKALDHERLEMVAAKLALSDMEYWGSRAKAKKGYTNKSITPSSEATSYTKDKRITELEEKLKAAEERTLELQAEVDRYKNLFVENRAVITKAKFNSISKPFLDKLKKEIDEL